MTHKEHRGGDDAGRRAIWRPATVVSVEPAAEEMIALALDPEAEIPHLPGQYLDLRFPGERRSRSFSIVSAPGTIELGIRVHPWGALSPRLAAAERGAAVEIRGPVGRGFTWTPDEPGPLVLIGAGAGVTPLVGMYDHAVGSSPPGRPRTVIFLASAGTPDNLFRYGRYKNSMITRFTATEPRIDQGFLAKHLAVVLGDPVRSSATRRAAPISKGGAIRVCGPGGFIGTVVTALLDLGVPPERIRSEGFT